jgi:hypothetical protein
LAELVTVKAIKTITIVGLLLGAGVSAMRGGDGTASLSLNDQIRAATLLFQDQKAEFLNAQRDDRKNSPGQLRKEIREQVAATTLTARLSLAPLRQELRQSIEAAKLQSIEQSRKLVQEAAEAARSRRGN